MRFLNDTCEPEEEATLQPFRATIGWQEPYYYKFDDTFYLKGLDDKALCTDGKKIEMGLGNRAFIDKKRNYGLLQQ